MRINSIIPKAIACTSTHKPATPTAGSSETPIATAASPLPPSLPSLARTRRLAHTPKAATAAT